MFLEVFTAVLMAVLSQPRISCTKETLPAPPAHPLDAEAELRSVPLDKNLNVVLVDGWQGQLGMKGGHFQQRDVSNLDSMCTQRGINALIRCACRQLSTSHGKAASCPPTKPGGGRDVGEYCPQIGRCAYTPTVPTVSSSARTSRRF